MKMFGVFFYWLTSVRVRSWWQSARILL